MSHLFSVPVLTLCPALCPKVHFDILIHRPLFLLLLLFKNTFIWLCWVLVVACGIFSHGMWDILVAEWELFIVACWI